MQGASVVAVGDLLPQRLGLLQCVFSKDHEERVQLPVQRVDPLKAVLNEGHGGEFAVPNPWRKLFDACERQIVIHGSYPRLLASVQK